MNTLMFITGAGVGMCATGLMFIYVLGTVTRGHSASKEHMKSTEDLLEERNKIDRRIEGHLSVVADWCKENWKR
ncbi:MAG TPA: hypothetical protein VFU31_22680 [Candidatus Binatia bacterium]|nr:hypothetical protein [Candidatus Binatia bacterium]